MTTLISRKYLGIILKIMLTLSVAIFNAPAATAHGKPYNPMVAAGDKEEV
jgi:hypothetical protein